MIVQLWLRRRQKNRGLAIVIFDQKGGQGQEKKGPSMFPQDEISGKLSGGGQQGLPVNLSIPGRTVPQKNGPRGLYGFPSSENGDGRKKKKKKKNPRNQGGRGRGGGGGLFLSFGPKTLNPTNGSIRAGATPRPQGSHGGVGNRALHQKKKLFSKFPADFSALFEFNSRWAPRPCVFGGLVSSRALGGPQPPGRQKDHGFFRSNREKGTAGGGQIRSDFEGGILKEVISAGEGQSRPHQSPAGRPRGHVIGGELFENKPAAATGNGLLAVSIWPSDARKKTYFEKNRDAAGGGGPGGPGAKPGQRGGTVAALKSETGNP